jgi:shikimate kinase
MIEANRKLLQDHINIHITAPKSIVFERIMINGKPAFFPKEQEPFEAFQKLWKEREPVFQNLATITVENVGTVEEAVENIVAKLK